MTKNDFFFTFRRFTGLLYLLQTNVKMPTYFVIKTAQDTGLIKICLINNNFSVIHCHYNLTYF